LSSRGPRDAQGEILVPAIGSRGLGNWYYRSVVREIGEEEYLACGNHHKPGENIT